jgi:hypothetical protein
VYPGILLVLLLATGAAKSQAPAGNHDPIDHRKEDQSVFREKYWPALKAQGWIFITYANAPLLRTYPRWIGFIKPSEAKAKMYGLRGC